MSAQPLATASFRPSVLRAPFGAWVAMAVLAVANGVFREVVLIPRIGEYPGHVLSTGMLVVAIFVVAWLFFGWSTVEYATAELLAIALIWVVLTVGFEFLVGYAEGTPPAVTIAQYDVFAGQVWIAVPIALFVSPLVFGR